MECTSLLLSIKLEGSSLINCLRSGLFLLLYRCRYMVSCHTLMNHCRNTGISALLRIAPSTSGNNGSSSGTSNSMVKSASPGFGSSKLTSSSPFSPLPSSSSTESRKTSATVWWVWSAWSRWWLDLPFYQIKVLLLSQLKCSINKRSFHSIIKLTPLSGQGHFILA